MQKEVNDFIQNLLTTQPNSDILILSGNAKGADRLGEQYAIDNLYPYEVFPAWWGMYGNSAGILRNIEMAKVAKGCIIFWDGVSKGSKHMIDTAKKYKLDTKVVLYNKGE